MKMFAFHSHNQRRLIYLKIIIQKNQSLINVKVKGVIAAVNNKVKDIFG